ncbi:MAG: hypothetical protein HPY69_16415 [Armatimonadetes bacterium]|nr:hypothetical protein [Armatimonadota bacterium]
MKKWQLSLVMVGLLGMVYAMNVVQQKRLEERAALEKAAKEARLKAESTHAAKLSPALAHSQTHGGGQPSFTVPPPAGPEKAPVKIEVFLDGSNACHATSTELSELSKVYGKLVRVVFLNMMKPEVSQKADKLQLGCAAGLAINGKVEMMLKTPNGKRLISFRGPANHDKYRTPDVYLAVNSILESKGIKVPKLAKERTVGAGSITPMGPGKMPGSH